MTEPLTCQFDNAKLIFKNFEGREGKYNAKGNRNFAVEIPDEKVAQAMLKDGWNVKYPNPREDEEETRHPHIPVAVNFKIKPPRIILITSGGRTNVNEDMVEMLDWADIKNVDLIVRSYEWSVNGKSGLKAYLKTMYVTLEEDDLDRRYAETDD